MEDFLYYAPTKVVFGKETESKVGELIKEEGAGSVLVVYGRQQRQTVRFAGQSFCKS